MNLEQQQAMANAIVAIDSHFDPASDRNQSIRRRNLNKARAKRTTLVTRFSMEDGYWPLMAYLSDMAPRQFETIEEARGWIRCKLRQIAAKKISGHWSYKDNAWKVRPLRDRLLIATYFARFSADLWSRAAA